MSVAATKRLHSARSYAAHMPDSWRDALAASDNLVPRPGCSDAAIAAAANDLAIALPPPLAEFLRETDGVYDRSGQNEYAWSLSRIVSENSEAWERQTNALPRD